MTTALNLGTPIEFGPIEMWPLTRKSGRIPNAVAGTAALAVEESSDPDPGTLHVANRGQTPVFLPIGYLFGGLQQSRMLVEDLLIGAGEDFEIPVACVEAGRFSDRQQSRPAGRVPVSVLAAALQPERHCRSRGGRQAAVWDAVTHQERRSGSRPTHSLEQVMQEDLQGPTVPHRIAAEIDRRFRSTESQVGMVIAVGGEPLVLEVFESANLGERLLGDLLRSVAFDVDHAYPFPCTPEQVSDFLKQARNTPFEAHGNSSGSYRLRGSRDDMSIHGTWLSPQECLHLFALNHNHQVLEGAAL
jgi:hypothetical protein